MTSLKEHGDEVIQGRSHWKGVPHPCALLPTAHYLPFLSNKRHLCRFGKNWGKVEAGGSSALPSYSQFLLLVTLRQADIHPKVNDKAPESHPHAHGDMPFRKCESRDFPSGEREMGWPACRTVTRSLLVWETGPEFRETTAFHSQLYQF